MKALLLIFLYVSSPTKHDPTVAPQGYNNFNEPNTAPVTVQSMRRELIARYHLNEHQALRLTPAIKAFLAASSEEDKHVSLALLNIELERVLVKRGTQQTATL